MTSGRHAPDEHAWVEGVPDHPDPIPEDRSAREWARGVDRDDAHLVSGRPPALDDLVAEGALAASRGTGHPDDTSQPGSLANLTEEVGDPGIPVLDHADRTRQGAGFPRHEALCELSFRHPRKSTGGPTSSRSP